MLAYIYEHNHYTAQATTPFPSLWETSEILMLIWILIYIEISFNLAGAHSLFVAHWNIFSLKKKFSSGSDRREVRINVCFQF